MFAEEVASGSQQPEASTATLDAPTGTVDPPAAPAPDWKDSLPDDLKANPTIRDVQTVEDMAKMTVETLSKIGAKRTLVPGEKATQEEMDAFFDEIGRPKTPADYQLKASEKLPEGVTIDEALLGEFAQHAHTNGLTAQQAHAEMGFYEKMITNQLEQAESLSAEQAESNINLLKKEWGDAFDQRVELAREAVRIKGGEPLAQYLKETGLGTNPDFVRMMSDVGAMMGEDRILGQSKANLSVTPADAQAKINELKADKEFMEAWTTEGHAGHADAMAKMQALNDAQYAGQKPFPT